MDFMKAAIVGKDDEAFPTEGAPKKVLDVPVTAAADAGEKKPEIVHEDVDPDAPAEAKPAPAPATPVVPPAVPGVPVAPPVVVPPPPPPPPGE
jgi:penicillin-binding protein 1A